MKILTSDAKDRITLSGEHRPPNFPVDDLSKENPLFYATVDLGYTKEMSSGGREEILVCYLLYRDLYHQLFDFDSDMYEAVRCLNFDYKDISGGGNMDTDTFLDEISFSGVRVDLQVKKRRSGESETISKSYRIALPTSFTDSMKNTRRKIKIFSPSVLLSLRGERSTMKNQVLVLQALNDHNDALKARIPESTYYRRGFDAILRYILKDKYGLCDMT